MMKRKKRFWAIAMTLIMCFGVTGVLSTDVKAAKTSEVQAQEEYPGDVIGTATIKLAYFYRHVYNTYGKGRAESVKDVSFIPYDSEYGYSVVK